MKRLTRTTWMTRTTQVRVAAMFCYELLCFPALLLRYATGKISRLCCIVTCERQQSVMKQAGRSRFQQTLMTCITCISGDGHSDEDDAAYARRLQDQADREHYARLMDGHGTLEAALQGGVPHARRPPLSRYPSVMQSSTFKEDMPSVPHPRPYLLPLVLQGVLTLMQCDAAGIAEERASDEEYDPDENDYLTDDSIDPDEMTYEVTIIPCHLHVEEASSCRKGEIHYAKDLASPQAPADSCPLTGFCETKA